MRDQSRRRFIQGVAAASTIGIAGCGGGDGDSDGSGDGGDGQTGDGGDGQTGDGDDGTAGDDGGTTTQTPVDYPTGEITSVVPYATGGGFDAYSRLAKPYWEEHLPGDPTVVVKNITGGGGVTGATQTYNAEADGHTFMLWDVYQSVTQQIGRDVGFDIMEMSHIGALTQSPNALITMKSANISSYEDLKGRIGELNWATQGVGSISHTAPVMFAELTGEFSSDNINFIHYEGTGPALGGLERGEADIFMVGTSTSGLKVVAALEAEMLLNFSNPERGEYFADATKTFASELDIDNIETFNKFTSFRRFYTGPPGVPEPVLEIQREAFSNLVNDQEFRTEADEASRPIINAGDAEQVETVLTDVHDTLNGAPYKSVLQGIFN